MSKKVDLEKLRSVGVLRPGFKKSKRRIMKDRRGSTQTEHWDGRVDAHVKPRSIKIESTKQGEN